MLEVIHISDTHFGPDRFETIRGANTYDHSVALVAAINALLMAHPQQLEHALRDGPANRGGEGEKGL